MRIRVYILLFFFLTLISGGLSVYFFLTEKLYSSVLFTVITLVLLCHILLYIFKIFRDVEDFSEAARYRDFSRRYNESKGRKNNFYREFNIINNVFNELSREKEVQQHYLTRMLELVDTGILSYDIESKGVLWMNNSFKNMFNIPYLENVNWIEKRNKSLYDELINIPLGESRIVAINNGNQTIKTLTNTSLFQTEGKTYKLIAFHNVSSTLEEVEAGAWKGLLDVMTHEIMNSIAPVSSLADTLRNRMEAIKQEIGNDIPADFDDIQFAMETIHRRSEGLLRFADTYRSLSKTIIPEMHPINLHELLLSIYRLMYPSLKQKGILLEVKTDNPSVDIPLDRNLMEQVVINFITNATNAVKEKPNPNIILFSGITTDGVPYLTVADNGCGIPPENRDKIFIPFFSTKKNGSGIGLSLSREIVKLHNATLQVQSKESEGAAFTILFKIRSN
jgi:Signal transduction histidine kinase regulating C4-dicarboxylate transport system